MKMTGKDAIGSGILTMMAVGAYWFLIPLSNMQWQEPTQMTPMGHEAQYTTTYGDMNNTAIKRAFSKSSKPIDAIQIGDVNVTIVEQTVSSVIITGVPADNVGTRKIWIWQDDVKTDSNITIEYKTDTFFDCGCATACMVGG